MPKQSGKCMIKLRVFFNPAFQIEKLMDLSTKSGKEKIILEGKLIPKSKWEQK